MAKQKTIVQGITANLVRVQVGEDGDTAGDWPDVPDEEGGLLEDEDPVP